MIKRGT